MRYLCLVYVDERSFDALPASERAGCVADHLAYREKLDASRQLVAADPLASVRSAVTVRRRGGKLSVTDGPFVETKEQLGGYFLIDVRDLNDAIRVASHIPSARLGAIEVRPLACLEGVAGCAGRAPREARGTRYLCLVCYEEAHLDALPKAQRDALVADNVACDEALVKSGQLIVANALAPVQSATLVRVRGGKLQVSDGPYAETKEQIGGFVLIAAKDLDDAIRVAARMPVARLGSIEVRAVHPLGEG